MQQNAPFCVLLKKIPFFHGFIILYLKFWLHRFYIQNAAECTILRPSEIFFSGGADSSPTAFSLSRVGMYRNVTYMIWWWVKIKGLLSSIIASDIFGHYIVFCESLKRFINKYVKWQYTNFIFKQFLMQ
jgi:hypothetical protein